MTSRRLIAAIALLASFLLPSLAQAWPHSSTSGVYLTNGVAGPRLLPDGSGGCFVIFYGYHDVTNGYDVYAQHYDSAGTPLWTAGGVLIAAAPDYQIPQAVVSDNAGGFVVAYQDYRAGGYNQMDVYAQHVNASGTPLWGTGGLAICSATGHQDNIRMVSGTNNGALIVWTDERNTATTGSDIYVQRVDVSNGSITMASNGTLVCNATGNQTSPDVAADEFGRALIAWSDLRSGPSDIYAQLIETTGAADWTANGVAVAVAANYQGEPRIRSISGYRAVVAWSDSRGGDYDVYAQKLEGYNGAALWAANGIPLCATTGTQIVNDAVIDKLGNLVVSYIDSRAGLSTQDIYVQKVDLSGTLQWGSTGLGVRTAAGTASNARLIAEPSGGVIVCWNEARVDNGDVYAQRVSPSGYTMWVNGGVPVCNAAESQQGQVMCAGTGSSGIIAWDDYRTGGAGIRLQAVDEWGFLGADPVMASVKDIPNDQGGQVKVSWYGSPLDTDPLFRNITDYIVFRSAPTRLAAQLARASDGRSATLNGVRYVQTRFAAQDYFWEELAHVPPRHLAQYSYLAPTEGDSVAGSNPRTAFMVMAIANYGSAWWVTKADSGYSVDNIPPLAPAPLTGQYAPSGTALHWNPNTEPDVAGYRVYRGSSPAFVPGPASLLATVADTGYVASGAAPYYYKLTAIDVHGNESPVATLMPSGTLGVGDDGTLHAEFAAPAPNPLRGGARGTLRFSLAQGGRTKLSLYDAQGRVVRVLVDGACEPGEHIVPLRGDGLAPGLYLARLEAPGFTSTRRVMVVE